MDPKCTCKTCDWWGKREQGRKFRRCVLADGDIEFRDHATSFGVAFSESLGGGVFVTGSDFGCNQWKPLNFDNP